jgi:acetyl-CoA C-acetyltransferase
MPLAAETVPMDVYLVDGARTPHGMLLGSLADVRGPELARIAIDGLLARMTPEPSDVDYVTLGNAIQGGLGQVPGRQAVVDSTLPESTPTTTINEASGSGLRAMMTASDHLGAGRADVAIAGGFESMTNAPWAVPDYRKGKRYGDVTMRDTMIYDALWDVNYDAHMGELTEELVDRFDISREAQDRYALESHRRAAEAIESGRFDSEIVPVETADGTVERDEGPRPESTLEDLLDLPTPFAEEGTVSPGNASKLADGAGVVLLASGDAVDVRDLDPLASFADYAVAYRDPKWFNMAVPDAVAALLDRNDLSVEDVDRFELNEAFAAQMVHAMDELDLPREKLNPDGGAVAFGHPIGASGGMLAATLADAMQEDDLERAVVGMSVGGGGAVMALLERP